MSIENKYDLEERTAVLGERIIDFVKSLPKNTINNKTDHKIRDKYWF